MHSNQEVVSPHKHLLINLVPSIMVMPGTASRIFLDEHESSQKLLRAVRAGQSPYLFAVMSDPRIKESPDRFCKIGVIAEAEADVKDPIILLRGMFRAEMTRIKRVGNHDWGLWLVVVKQVEDGNNDDYFIQSQHEVVANTIKIRDLLVGFMIRARGYYEFEDTLMSMIIDNFENTDWSDKDAVDNFIWMTLHAVPDLFQKDKQPFLESTSLPERIELCIKKLKERLRLLEAQKRASLKDEKKVRRAKNVRITDSNDQDQDEFIRGAHEEIKKRWEKFKGIRDYMNEDAREVVKEDIERLKSFGNPQGNTYEWPKFMKRLDFILALPWKEETEQESDIIKVARILDEDHYGLVHVKNSICEQVAPRLLNPEGKSHIICLTGPPGVGKTSLAKSVARALNRKYIRMSVGGIRDEAQIRGHGVTYIGAEAGEILKLMKRCGAKNPIFVIDEIDKLGHMSTAGDPSAAMLEVLDPEQNNSFKDHYADCGFDLSKVMFIATGNVEYNIDPVLLDRMDVIHLHSYLEVEKIEIAKKYLIPRWLQQLGLAQNNVEVIWEEEIISKIIRSYTSEAGVRNLERTIAAIFRKICRDHLKSKNEGNPVFKFEVTESKVHEYFGPPKFFKDRVKSTVIGEAIGLAWTPVGGQILYVQAQFYDREDDKKVLSRTGMQGKVMKESDELALTRLRNILKENSSKWTDVLKGKGIHLHIPEGAVEKDGPSAGVAIITALYSEATKQLVKPNLAMTGEIDNKARVLAVGGVREKVVAAERAGIEEIIMPKDNERNLHDVPKDVKDKLKFNFVESIDQVLEIAFPRPLN